MLEVIVDFYTNHLDQARDVIAAVLAAHRETQAGRQHELASVNGHLAAKEAIVDRYLMDYEDNTIDRDTVARRVENLSEHIRQLRNRSDELIFLLDAGTQEPDGSHLVQMRDRIAEIIKTGTVYERKALCEALVAELHQSGLSVSGVTAATFSVAQVSRSTSSSWEKDRLARYTWTPPCHSARANGRPAYTSNPPPAPAISTLRARLSAVNSGGTANEDVPGGTGDGAVFITTMIGQQRHRPQPRIAAHASAASRA
jgi:hypothetical protein